MTVSVLSLLLVPRVGLQCVIVVFPVHTHVIFALVEQAVFHVWTILLNIQTISSSFQ